LTSYSQFVDQPFLRMLHQTQSQTNVLSPQTDQSPAFSTDLDAFTCDSAALTAKRGTARSELLLSEL
jgi:hypothetical protein